MTHHGRERLPRSLVDEIDHGVQTSRAALDRVVAGSTAAAIGHPLAIKYMPSKYGALYTSANPGLRISERDGFTWGTAVYVTPLCHPISNGIYGRAGVVSWFDPTGWLVFDSTDPAVESLYLAWLRHQPMLRDVLVTVHSDYRNHLLRDQFRQQFNVDCVLFHPDECDSGGLYTRPGDVWMAVGDFDVHGDLVKGDSRKFHDARLTVVLEEEFEVDTPALTRSAVLKLTSTRQPDALLIADITTKYLAKTGWTRVSS